MDTADGRSMDRLLFAVNGEAMATAAAKGLSGITNVVRPVAHVSVCSLPIDCRLHCRGGKAVQVAASELMEAGRRACRDTGEGERRRGGHGDGTGRARGAAQAARTVELLHEVTRLWCPNASVCGAAPMPDGPV